MEKLLDTIQVTRDILTQELLAYVKEYGKDYSDNPDYWSNQFGIEEEDGYKVTKVLDFYGKDGCESIIQRNANPGISIDSRKTFETLLDILSDEFEYTAFLQLYIEVDDGGYETLMYSCLHNTGICHFDSISESEHEPVSNLNLSDIENIIYVIYKTFKP